MLVGIAWRVSSGWGLLVRFGDRIICAYGCRVIFVSPVSLLRVPARWLPVCINTGMILWNIYDICPGILLSGRRLSMCTTGLPSLSMFVGMLLIVFAVSKAEGILPVLLMRPSYPVLLRPGFIFFFL
ncbi:uncharacterized protein LOC135164606 [Diachasmimorpha longicaudata]|uniref:uncharacterized protein LOC135164606 n=1 Tax=Diachasmimorpha longicaudata TaxID=58733 RepID=UPI0030B88A9A